MNNNLVCFITYICVCHSYVTADDGNKNMSTSGDSDNERAFVYQTMTEKTLSNLEIIIMHLDISELTHHSINTMVFRKYTLYHKARLSFFTVVKYQSFLPISFVILHWQWQSYNCCSTYKANTKCR